MEIFTDQTLAKWLTFNGPAPEVAPTDGNYTWGSYRPSHLITHLHYQFIVPPFNFVNPFIVPSLDIETETLSPITTETGSDITTETGADIQILPFIVGQFNYNLSQPFTMPNWPLLKLQLKNFYVCVKFRVGTQVVRYVISDKASVGDVETEDVIPITDELGNPILQEPDTFHFLPLVKRYTGQLILPNFCIEIWSMNERTDPLSLTSSVNVLSSIRFEPLLETDTDIYVNPVQSYITQFIPFPATFPVIFDGGQAWLTN